jgi:hypothetical protein
VAKQQTQTSKSMKTSLIALCTVVACLLAPTGTMFGGGPAPNELVIEEEKVVRDVALSPSYTSFLCVEEQSAIGTTFALDHRDTADPFKSAAAAQPDTVYRVTGLEGHLAKACTSAFDQTSV